MKSNRLQTVAFFIISLIMFRPEVVSLVPTIDTLFDVLRISISIALLFYIIAEHRITINLLLFLLYFICIGLSTILNEGDYFRVLKIIGASTGVLLIVFIAIQFNGFQELMNAWNILFAFLIIGNLFTIILFPNGIWRTEYTANPCYLLGHRNVAASLTSIYSGYIILRSVLYFGKIRKVDWVIISFTMIGIVLTWSATSLVSCSVFILLVVVYQKRKFRYLPIIRLETISLASFAISYGFVFTKIELYFQWFIVNVLRKSITLSGRRYIWDRVITYAISKPWLGWGYETEAIERIKFTILGAHNGWLDMFYHGGIILLAVFSVLLVYAGYRLFKFRNVPAFVPIMLIMCFYIVRFIAEPLPSTISFGMLLATMLIAMNVQLVYTQIKMIDKPQRDRHEQAFENSTYLYIQ